MGYACPVCASPQADAGHLANHLAFTALLRSGEHETWLDEHVPDWSSMDRAALGDVVVEHATETDYPQVFEDTTGRGADESGDHPGHGAHDHREGVPHPLGAGLAGETDSFPDGVDFSALREDDAIDDEELDEIIDHARELTRRRRDDSETE